MDLTIFPGLLRGTIRAIPSKSQAHRLLICAAFADAPTTLVCSETNQDIEATARCLRSLGANVLRTEAGYYIEPITQLPTKATLDCGESGSTLRFILPVVCALGVECIINMSGRLPYRPLSPLWEELQRMGCNLSRPTETSIHSIGKLMPGQYSIPGNISSQYISGLMFALSLLDKESSIHIEGKLESRPYVDMTQNALSMFGVSIQNFQIKAPYCFHSPGMLTVEGDWSNAAFFLVANALGSKIDIENLNTDSLQGDRAVMQILQMTNENVCISGADIPDLIPILAVYFAAKNGAKFSDIVRLRLKESDRVTVISNMLRTLGIEVLSTENTMEIIPGKLQGGIVDACNDHRIAMAAAIAATIANGPVTIRGVQCVAKSYPSFWDEFRRLGGNYEQHIR